jgi:TonB-dependent SusC/RagA subfamily outer membrane receptor
MRTLYIFSSIILILGLTVNAQTNPLSDRPVRIDNKPLFLVDNFRTESNYLIIDPNNIESVTILKDSASVAKYGQEGKNGVVIVVPKKIARLLPLQKILDKYSLSQHQNKLKVCINKTLMPTPDLILIDETEIVNVEITTERIWKNTEAPATKEKYINIVVKERNISGR